MAPHAPATLVGEAKPSSNAVRLDGRTVRTPGKNVLAVPSAALAQAIASEWSAQGGVIEPETMPLTRLANTAIDGVAGREREARDDIVAFAGRDLLCYRADAPAELATLQGAAWDPLLAWAKDRLGARFILAEGVMPVEQGARTLDAVRAALNGWDAFALAPLHVMTTLTGSAILALAVAEGQVAAPAAWAAAHVDEDWQTARWGVDAEAAQRRERRWREMEAASRFLALAREG